MRKTTRESSWRVTVSLLRFESGPARGETANVRNSRERDARQAGAEHGFAADPAIQRLVQVHGAQVVPESVRPLGDA